MISGTATLKGIAETVASVIICLPQVCFGKVIFIATLQAIEYIIVIQFLASVPSSVPVL